MQQIGNRFLSSFGEKKNMRMRISPHYQKQREREKESNIKSKLVRSLGCLFVFPVFPLSFWSSSTRGPGRAEADAHLSAAPPSAAHQVQIKVSFFFFCFRLISVNIFFIFVKCHNKCSYYAFFLFVKIRSTHTLPYFFGRVAFLWKDALSKCM